MFFLYIEVLLLCIYFFFKWHGFRIMSCSPIFLFDEVAHVESSFFFDYFIFFFSLVLIILERLMWFFYIKKNIRLTYKYYWLYLYIWYLITLIFIYLFYFFISYFITYYQIHFLIFNFQLNSFISCFNLYNFIQNPFLFLLDITNHVEVVKGLSGTWLVKPFDFYDKKTLFYNIFNNLNEITNTFSMIDDVFVQRFIEIHSHLSVLDFIYKVESYYQQLNVS